MCDDSCKESVFSPSGRLEKVSSSSSSGRVVACCDVATLLSRVSVGSMLSDCVRHVLTAARDEANLICGVGAVAEALERSVLHATVLQTAGS